MDIARRFVREPGTSSVAAYRQRIWRLSAIYIAIVLVAVSAIALILIRAKFFITLSQRSNVETLTLAFIIVLFAYLALLSLPGAWGALKIVYYNAPRWLGRDRLAVERRKQAALQGKIEQVNPVYLNCLVRLQGQPHAPIVIALADQAGSLGRIVIDGAKIAHREPIGDGSISVFAFVEQRIRELVQQRDPEAEINIVQWASTNDEQAAQYASLVTFSESLAQALNSGPLWPVVELTGQELEILGSDLNQLCPTLRDEAFLPDWEYQAEHRLPIIPEPLGFVSLSRSEQRADPVASMGCALIVAVVILAILVFLIFVPPWVPSK